MKHEIKVCMGSSCFARGNMNNLSCIEKFINENKLETELELIGAHCQDKCENGPHILVDGNDYSEVDEEKIKEILEKLINS